MTFEYPYVGMILPDAQDLAPGPYLATAARILEELDPRLDGAPTVTSGGRVLGRSIGLTVMPQEFSDFGPRMLLEVVTVDGTPPDDGDAARLLSDTVCAALEHSSADILEWYAPDALIDREDFLRLRNFVSPRRIVQIDADVEDALFESADAAQEICGTLYPEAPAEQADQVDALPAVVPEPEAIAAPRRRFGFGFGLRRSSQMVAVTGLIAVLGFSGQMQFFVNHFLH